MIPFFYAFALQLQMLMATALSASYFSARALGVKLAPTRITMWLCSFVTCQIEPER